MNRFRYSDCARMLNIFWYWKNTNKYIRFRLPHIYFSRLKGGFYFSQRALEVVKLTQELRSGIFDADEAI